MKANEFKLMRRKNLGNYEHEEVTLSMTVEDDDNLDQVIEFTQVKVAEALGLQPKVENIKEVLENGEVTTNGGRTVDAGTGKKVSKKSAPKAKKKVTRKKADRADVPVEQAEVDTAVDTPNYTLDQVKGKLAQVWKSKGKSIAIDILTDFKVAKSDELNEADYAEVVAKAEKCLA